MPKLKVLPGHAICPEGTEIKAEPGKSICDTLLEHHIDIEHACEKQAACTTCHVILRQGYDSLEPPEEKEEDMLDKAWGLEARSEEHTSELQSPCNLVCRLLLEKKKKKQ